MKKENIHIRVNTKIKQNAISRANALELTLTEYITSLIERDEKRVSRWEILDNGSAWCPVCKENDRGWQKYNFCPNCGADMRGYAEQKILADQIIGALEMQPTADVREVKHGHWIEYRPEHGKCSICGNRVDLTRPEECNFCSNCGADMRGVEWSIDSLMTQHHENYAKAGCEPLKRSDYDPFK